MSVRSVSSILNQLYEATLKESSKPKGTAPEREDFTIITRLSAAYERVQKEVDRLTASDCKKLVNFFELVTQKIIFSKADESVRKLVLNVFALIRKISSKIVDKSFWHKHRTFCGLLCPQKLYQISDLINGFVRGTEENTRLHGLSDNIVFLLENCKETNFSKLIEDPRFFQALMTCFVQKDDPLLTRLVCLILSRDSTRQELLTYCYARAESTWNEFINDYQSDGIRLFVKMVQKNIISWNCAEDGSEPMLFKYIKNGIQIEKLIPRYTEDKKWLGCSDSEGNTLLHTALKTLSRDLAIYLIKNMSEEQIQKVNSSGETALLVAIRSKLDLDDECFAKLLGDPQRGIINIPDKNGLTPLIAMLMFAEKGCNGKMIEWLLDKGADHNWVMPNNGYPMTAFHVALFGFLTSVQGNIYEQKFREPDYFVRIIQLLKDRHIQPPCRKEMWDLNFFDKSVGRLIDGYFIPNPYMVSDEQMIAFISSCSENCYGTADNHQEIIEARRSGIIAFLDQFLEGAENLFNIRENGYAFLLKLSQKITKDTDKSFIGSLIGLLIQHGLNPLTKDGRLPEDLPPFMLYYIQLFLSNNNAATAQIVDIVSNASHKLLFEQLQRFFESNDKIGSDVADSHGWTLFEILACRQDLSIDEFSCAVKLLKEHCITNIAKLHSDGTSLVLRLCREFEEFPENAQLKEKIEILLENGAGVSCFENGKSLLHKIVGENLEQTFLQIFQNRLDQFWDLDFEGKTPLYCISSYDICRILDQKKPQWRDWGDFTEDHYPPPPAIYPVSPQPSLVGSSPLPEVELGRIPSSDDDGTEDRASFLSEDSRSSSVSSFFTEGPTPTSFEPELMPVPQELAGLESKILSNPGFHCSDMKTPSTSPWHSLVDEDPAKAIAILEEPKQQDIERKTEAVHSPEVLSTASQEKRVQPALLGFSLVGFLVGLMTRMFSSLLPGRMVPYL